ncbi:MAG: glycosyltransferase [Acetobacteraceae bacterium]|nr:glycosyltransferase [Acetobacteraceae bacterium]
MDAEAGRAATPLVLHVFPTFDVGGAQARFATLANRLGPRLRHLVVAMDGRYGCRERLDPALDIGFPEVEISKGDTRGNLRRFRAALTAWRPDLLVTSNWGSVEWAIAAAIPPRPVRHLHMEDGFGPEERDRQMPRRVWTRRLVLARSLTVVPSRNLERIARTVWRLPRGRLRYVPNGVDLTRAAPAFVPGEGLLVGTVAALRAEKNIERLLRAFALAAEERAARLLIVGDGPERAELERLAGELGIAARVRFAGHVPAPAGLVAAMDVFALSSDTEQMPLSLLEAMAAAKPVAATAVGDVADMLAPANRPYAVERDDAALAGALSALLDDAALRQVLGDANRARAEAVYSEDAMVEAWAGLLGAARG